MRGVILWAVSMQSRTLRALRAFSGPIWGRLTVQELELLQILQVAGPVTVAFAAMTAQCAGPSISCRPKTQTAWPPLSGTATCWSECISKRLIVAEIDHHRVNTLVATFIRVGRIAEFPRLVNKLENPRPGEFSIHEFVSVSRSGTQAHQLET